MMEEGTDTNPAAGVMATRPATVPVNNPTNVGFLSLKVKLKKYLDPLVLNSGADQHLR